MRAAQQIFKVHTRHGNLDPSWFISVTGSTPEWVTKIAEPFEGEIPRGRPIWNVDPGAEQRETAEREAQKRREQAADPRLTNSESMKYLDWDESDYVEARDRHEFPKCDALRVDAGDLLGTTGEPTRRRERD